jgi:hypothetical protein
VKGTLPCIGYSSAVPNHCKFCVCLHIFCTSRLRVAGQDRNKERFNRKHAAMQNVIEKAFGRLKTRWRALLKENELHLKNQNFMILACLCLHNICEVRNEMCPPDDAKLQDLVRMYKLRFPFEQQRIPYKVVILTYRCCRQHSFYSILPCSSFTFKFPNQP